MCNNRFAPGYLVPEVVPTVVPTVVHEAVPTVVPEAFPEVVSEAVAAVVSEAVVPEVIPSSTVIDEAVIRVEDDGRYLVEHHPESAADVDQAHLHKVVDENIQVIKIGEMTSVRHKTKKKTKPDSKKAKKADSKADDVSARISEIQAQCKALEERAAAAANRVRNLKRKVEAAEASGPAARVKVRVVSDFLKKKGFTEAQVGLGSF